MSSPSYSQRNTKKTIISPWDRTVQAMLGTTTKSSSAAASSNGYTHHIHSNSTLGSNGSINGYINNTNNSNSYRRSIIERIAIISMLMIAWGWIMTFCGMLFYHGYQYRISSGGMGTGDATSTTTMSRKKSLPIVPIQEEASKHQLESRKVIRNDNHGLTSESDIEPQSDAIPLSMEAGESPLLIFTCQRAKYLEETLSYILQYIPSDCTIGCPIIVSQDGHNSEVGQVIKDYQVKFQQDKNIPLLHIEHKSGAHVRVGVKAVNPYEALAIHYGWALQQVFDGVATAGTTTTTFALSKKIHPTILPQRVIILEEDLRIAPDFFAYFKAMAPILDHDATLLAVSAFNDNGFTDTVKDPTRVLRSDFFPGLGWMMARKLWVNELQSKWPSGYWDDWLREPQQRLNRQILRPEISRTYHFGTSGGASSNQFGTQLSKVFLNEVNVDWTAIVDNSKGHSLSYYLQNPIEYDRQYWNLIEGAKLLQDVAEVYIQARDGDVRLEYNSIGEFKSIVQQLKVPLMDDEKAGIYRTAYKGIVETRPLGNDHFLFIAPPISELRLSFANVLPGTVDTEDSRR
jgi:alpha-1,3-mannosyl-glycoprotein beta-1,2-N-acetylglucosaminyltransferase